MPLAALTRNVTRRRRLFLNLVFAALIGGSLYDIAADEEHWPFSQYPMFSTLWRTPTFSWLRLFGVDAAGREFPLSSNRYIQPFDQSRLPKALRKIMDGPNGAGDLHVALEDCLARYEALRLEGRHDGPPLTALRLYDLVWTIEPYAANLDAPDRKTLVAEVHR
jgi:hypothetical protein